MLRAGYDVKLASGVITAGGTLGILIPPSVMIIVYAAVAGQSVVKLYAAAMLPGFLLAFLYLVYIVGWATLRPKIAPPLPEEQTRVPVPAWMRVFQSVYSPNMFFALLLALFAPANARADRRRRQAHQLLDAAQELRALAGAVHLDRRHAVAGLLVRRHSSAGRGAEAVETGLQQLGAPVEQSGAHRTRRARELLRLLQRWPLVFGAIMIVRYYWNLTAERFELLKLLTSSVMPLGILTVVVLGVILFGITTATESAGVGAAGAFLLALHARTLNWKRTKEAVFLTAKTTAMVCWLFVGSALFSGVFAILGGQALLEQWVLSLNLTPGSVHDPVAGDHLPAGLAAGMDRDHHHLRADLPADAAALRHRPDPVGRAGVHQPAGGVPVAAGGDVGLLPEGRRAARM